MRKTYIIKDVRKTLAQQINNLDTAERTAMENTPLSSTGLSAVIPKDNDGYCTVYKMDCADGLGLMTVYQVYPGIQLIYCNILCLHSRSSRHRSRNHSSDPYGFSEQPIPHREQSRPQLHLLQSFRLLSGWHSTSHPPWAASSLHTARTCRKDGLPTPATANP